MGEPDYHLDLSSLSSPSPSAHNDEAAQARRGVPWLAVHWRCCQTYSRIYRNRDATAYQGRCPRCGRLLTIPIAPDGTTCRFFEAW